MHMTIVRRLVTYPEYAVCDGVAAGALALLLEDEDGVDEHAQEASEVDVGEHAGEDVGKVGQRQEQRRHMIPKNNSEIDVPALLVPLEILTDLRLLLLLIDLHPLVIVPHLLDLLIVVPPQAVVQLLQHDEQDNGA